MNVSQANSLTKVYTQAPLERTERTAESGGTLGGMRAERGTDGIPRSYAPKTQWQRFTSRLKQGWNSLTTKTSSDKGANQAAIRFNSRHELFSGKISNLVSRLATGNAQDVSDPKLLATLRNDVRAMNRDAPWASRAGLLATRMDVELGRLSGEQLATLAETLNGADRSQLTDKDKADLQTMQRAVLRQQLARSPEMNTLLGTVDSAAPHNVEDRQTLMDRLETMSQRLNFCWCHVDCPQER
jgi:hypothetical protein